MIAKGNGDPIICANNLLRIVRGEVPFVRLNGLSSRLIDRPMQPAISTIKADAKNVIEIFEPRVQVNGISVNHGSTDIGGLLITADLKKKEGG